MPHTLGPWTYERLHPHMKGSPIGTGNLSNPTASTLIATAWNTTKGLSGPKDEETEANAWLIAAAPDLLEALQGLNHVDKETGYCICPLNDGRAEMKHHATACANARASIAKATGKE